MKNTHTKIKIVSLSTNDGYKKVELLINLDALYYKLYEIYTSGQHFSNDNMKLLPMATLPIDLRTIIEDALQAFDKVKDMVILAHNHDNVENEVKILGDDMA